MQVNAKIFKGSAVAIVGAAVLYLGALGVCSTFDPEVYAAPELPADASEQQKAQVIADALTFALEHELDRPFGWITNDLMFVPQIIDNLNSYQSGVIYATRPASDMAAKTIARVGERDTIDSRLADATSRYFTYGDNVWGFWFIYDCEGKYRAGIKGWKDWAAAVGTTGRNAAIYNVKSDDVYDILKYCSLMTDYALGILNDTEMGHFKSDNNIYYVKGVAAVAGNLLKGIAAVDDSVRLRGGAENLAEALKRFAYIEEFDPLYTFAGGSSLGDDMMPNHVAALARHFDIANNRLNDMLASMEK